MTKLDSSVIWFTNGDLDGEMYIFDINEYALESRVWKNNVPRSFVTFFFSNIVLNRIEIINCIAGPVSSAGDGRRGWGVSINATFLKSSDDFRVKS